MSLLSECCDWGTRRSHKVGAAAGTRDELLLQCSLGQALTFSRGMQRDAKVALTRAVALAEAWLTRAIRFVPPMCCGMTVFGTSIFVTAWRWPANAGCLPRR